MFTHCSLWSLLKLTISILFDKTIRCHHKLCVNEVHLNYSLSHSIRMFIVFHFGARNSFQLYQEFLSQQKAITKQSLQMHINCRHPIEQKSTKNMLHSHKQTQKIVYDCTFNRFNCAQCVVPLGHCVRRVGLLITINYPSYLLFIWTLQFEKQNEDYFVLN